MKPQLIMPGATVGVLGSGQLGRMFALAARRMGYRVHTFSPYTGTPAGQTSDVEFSFSYDDLSEVRRFAEGVDVITFEFEHIPAATLNTAARFAPVRPGIDLLLTAQNRVREKSFLKAHQLPHVDFMAVTSATPLATALAFMQGEPLILKSAEFGYDGKGQSKIGDAQALAAALQTLSGEHVLEKQVNLACEISIIGARGLDGTFDCYPPFLNQHHHHILDTSCAPAPLSTALQQQATEITRTIFEAMQVVGVLCVEFFVSEAGALYVNEIAPRPHNSGHLTIDAAITSQFEQQLRAVCGLPLGSMALTRPAAMANLLGDEWFEEASPPPAQAPLAADHSEREAQEPKPKARPPHWAALLGEPDIKLHLYGKIEARAGRKMGHITTLGATPEEALKKLQHARQQLRAK